MATQTKKITLDTAALVVGRVGGLLLGIIRLRYLGEYLGLDNFGLLNSAAFFVALFQSLFDFGLSQLLTREIARNLSSSRTLLGRVLVLKLLLAMGAGSVILCAALVSGFNEATNVAILLTTVAQMITSVSLAFLSALQAHRRMVLVSGLTIVNDIVLSSAIIIVLPSFPHVPAVLLLTGGAALVQLAALSLSYGRLVGAPLLRIDLAAWKMLLKEGFPLAVSALGISVYTFIGPTVLRYTRGETEVGIFSAGYKLVSIYSLLPVAFTQVVYPLFSGFHEHAPEKLEKALRDALRVMMQISFPLAVGTIILAPDVIAFLYPPAFAEGATVLRVIVSGNALGFLAWILYSFLVAIRHQRFSMWNSLVIAVLVLSASLLAVAPGGFLAAAFIAMGTEVVLFTSMAFYTRRIGYRVLDLPLAARVLFASLLMGVVVWLLVAVHPVAAAAAGAVVYGTLLVMMGTFGDQEREILAKAFGRREGPWW